jgi:hypothetical protein
MNDLFPWSDDFFERRSKNIGKMIDRRGGSDEPHLYSPTEDVIDQNEVIDRDVESPIALNMGGSVGLNQHLKQINIGGPRRKYEK